MNRQNLFSFLVLGVLYSIPVLPQSSVTIFNDYFTHALTLADACPREKVHLHFDNTSYYVGDTIWFKAYTVIAENNNPSKISTPLYVELVDQMGRITDKQIVKLTNGEGHGQFILTKNVLSGYYEVRAYTKWLLAFGNDQYFSRTFPIYRKVDSYNDDERSIATYRWTASPQQRPIEKKEKFVLRFFPEGGSLVTGIPSIVAFKTESEEEEDPDVSGAIYSPNSTDTLSIIKTQHGGMGSFIYIPTSAPATAKVQWKGKDYTFQLPEALPSGYVLSVQNRGKQLEIRVMRSNAELQDELAVFLSHQGRPLICRMVDWQGENTNRLVLLTDELPDGVVQVSLVTSQGAVLCDRFCYIRPKDELVQLQAKANSPLYQPYEPVTCRFSLKDLKGKPLKGQLSVSIRDRKTSDYLEHDNTLYTDLLLTSDLKGYIHAPGYYFAENSMQRQRELDVLILIHGWRKYDMGALIGKQPFSPYYQPEKKLTLHGQVKSIILKRDQANIIVSVLARTDKMMVAGSTLSDSLGYFNIPVNDFNDKMEAVFQTRKKGKDNNRMCSVLLSRNFSPALRTYDSKELNPPWDNKDGLDWLSALSESLYTDSVFGSSDHRLEEVKVTAKRIHRKLNTRRFEQSIIAYYDVEQVLDQLRDEGQEFLNIPSFLAGINRKIVYADTQWGGSSPYATAKSANSAAYEEHAFPDNRRAFYGNRAITYIVNGQLDSWWQMDDIDAVKYIMLCEGSGAFDILDAANLNMGHLSLIDNYGYNDRYEQPRLNSPTSEYEKGIACYIATKDNWNPYKKYVPARGIRHTTIQGYSRPLEFYSPVYLPNMPLPSKDQRRTLYWNPNLETDENGEAVVKCYNASNSTMLTISAETLYEGHPASLLMHSTGLTE